jgi:monoamine oxidase
MSDHIIIVGAGAAGLMAAKELSKSHKVTVLEARSKPGGRIRTEYDFSSGTIYELGAEFVHGKLPLTLKLLEEAGLPYHEMEGEMWQVKGDELVEDEQVIEHRKLFNRRLKDLQHDQTIDEFLQAHFSDDKYASLKESVRRYAAGYDTADPAKASAIALREEWQAENNDEQYRIAGGYHQLINYMAETCVKQGCDVVTDAEVKEIRWEKDSVSAVTSGGKTYSGTKIIVTIPLNVLKAPIGEKGSITFSPAIPAVQQAVMEMEMGAIIKILLLFREPFWTSGETAKRTSEDLEKMSFIFSRERVPTWWTQFPRQSPLLTGWLGGPAAEKLKDTTDEEILTISLESLAHIFKTTAEEIRGQLAEWKIINWTAASYARGSYSYATVATKYARQVLAEPVDNTIYFAGEALYEGAEMGTVEAALASGRQVAHMIGQTL